MAHLSTSSREVIGASMLCSRTLGLHHRRNNFFNPGMSGSGRSGGAL